MQISDLFYVPANWLLANSASILGAIAILIAGRYAARWASQTVRHLLPRAYGVDKNFAPLLSEAARYGIMIFAAVTALNLLGVANTTILAVLGAAGLAVALALQGTLANIAAGIMLIWLRPIAIGEYIQGDGVAGIVVEQNQLPCLGIFGDIHRVDPGAVAPAFVAFVFLRGVLGIEDQDVSAFGKFAHLLVQFRNAVLIVRRVDDHCAV